MQKMFYEKILVRDTGAVIPRRPRKKQLPIILDRDEVKKLINSYKNLKHRTLLLGTYSAGLRVSEIVSLQPVHIERNRMMIRVERGKGRKDRYTILSKRFLSELEKYCHKYRPKKYLFYGSDKAKPMAIGTAQKIYYQAKNKAGITGGRGVHTLRHCFATHLMEQGVEIYLCGNIKLNYENLYLYLAGIS